MERARVKNRRWLRNSAANADYLYHRSNLPCGRLEIQLRTKLVSPRISYHATRPAVVRARWQRSGIVAAEVVAIEDIEHVEGESKGRRGSPEAGKILTQAHVDVPVRERARDFKAPDPPRIGRLIRQATESAATGIQAVLSAERREPGPLNAP